MTRCRECRHFGTYEHADGTHTCWVLGDRHRARDVCPLAPTEPLEQSTLGGTQ